MAFPVHRHPVMDPWRCGPENAMTMVIPWGDICNLKPVREIYRYFSGQDLTSEDVKLELLGPKPN